MLQSRIAFASMILAIPAWTQEGPKTDAEREAFLSKAKVVRTKGAPGGITGSIRATLSDGVFTHDAHIQSIDESKAQYTGPRGTELNFRDSYKYNVAAYRLDRLLGLNMVPPTVVRSHSGHSSSFTWWADDFLMDEAKHLKSKASPPDNELWNREMYLVRMFDQLIHNTDRNLGNLLITKDWHIVMIDHTRAFRTHTTLQDKRNLAQCDRDVLAKLKELNQQSLSTIMKDLLTPPEIQGLLGRRDKIVEFFEAAGPSALYTLPKDR